jgi:hypothetical protein
MQMPIISVKFKQKLKKDITLKPKMGASKKIQQSYNLRESTKN